MNEQVEKTVQENLTVTLPAIPADVQALTVDPSLAEASLPITTAEEYQKRVEQVRGWQARSKRLEEFRKFMTAPLDEAKKRWMDFFGPVIKRYTDAADTAKRGIVEYEQEQEQQRLAAAATAESASKAEADRLRKAADKAEGKGAAEAAASMRLQADMVAGAGTVPPLPTAAGTYNREKYSCEVHDLKELVKAVLAGTVPAMAIMANEKFLDNQARQMKEDFNYPGCTLRRGTTKVIRK